MVFAAGYGIAIMILVQTYYSCELGEHIDVSVYKKQKKWNVALHFKLPLCCHSFDDNQDNGLSDAFYNSNWYVLPIKMQKDLAHLIHGTQNGEQFSVGPFDIINRSYFNVVIIIQYNVYISTINV